MPSSPNVSPDAPSRDCHRSSGGIARASIGANMLLSVCVVEYDDDEGGEEAANLIVVAEET